MPSGFHTWSQTAASNGTADSNINWAEGQAPSSVNDSSRAGMAVLAKWRDDNNGSLTTGGTSTAYTLTTNTVFTSLALMANQTLTFTMHTTSGATPTLNVDGLGAKVIRNATGVALPTGALLSGSVYRATYNNSSGEWLIHNQPGVLPTSSVTTTAIADSNVTLAKMADLAQNKVIGRYTASTGVPQALTLSTGLAVDSSTGNITTTTNPSLFPGFLSGLELSTAGSSATFGIAAGAANDTTNATLMALTSAYTKTTSAWSVGSGNGALDTGTIATNTWYHVFLIARSDTGVVDVLVSTSVSSPTMPTNYDRKRRIGSMKTNGSSQWTKFSQTGDTFLLDTMVNTTDGSLSTTATNYTTGAPTGVKTTALLRVGMLNSSASVYVVVSSPDESDQAASASTASISNPVAGVRASTTMQVLTNTSAQVRGRSDTASTTISLTTYGWIDSRGK